MHTSTQILVSTRPVLLALVKGGPQGPPGPGTGAPVRLTFSSTVNTAALGDADIYACIDTTAARTLTISTATILQGTPTRPRVITITDDSGGAGANNITIDTEGAQTIDGAASALITVGFGTVALLSDGVTLTSVSGSGNTNAADRTPLTADPAAIVDVYSASDLPAAVVAPDGILRVPLVSGVQYLVHTVFVWPRILLPIGGGGPSVVSITGASVGATLLMDGDSTPHIWGRNIDIFEIRDVGCVDIGNVGTGGVTALFDVTGGSDVAIVIFFHCAFSGFLRLGDLRDTAASISSGMSFNGVVGGIVSSFTGIYELLAATLPSLVLNNTGKPSSAPMWSFLGSSVGSSYSMSIGNINLKASDAALYIDQSFTKQIIIASMGYEGTSAGDFFRADVNMGLTGEVAADKSISSFSTDVRAIVSVAASVSGSTFNAGRRHNWRVGDAVTHTGFATAGYNGVITITSITPFTYSATAVPFVSDDSGTATHDLSTLVTFSGQGLYRGQTVLLGGATPGAYAGLRFILAVEDDEDGFTIPVAFGPGGTGTIQITRVTTASNHPMVRGETHTIAGTAAYNGTRAILNLPADDQFDISAAFATNEGAVGTVLSSSLDETGLNINAVGNGAQKDSKSIGSVVAGGNAVSTTITMVNTWTDLDLGTLAAAGSNIERWGSVNSTTGEVTYLGIAEFSGELRASLSVTSSGGSQGFQFRAVVNGSPLSDGVVVSVDLSNSPMISVTLLAPIQCVTGDTVRIQVQNTSGTSNVTVQDLSGIIS